jgi:hypothetical protein
MRLSLSDDVAMSGRRAGGSLSRQRSLSGGIDHLQHPNVHNSFQESVAASREDGSRSPSPMGR